MKCEDKCDKKYNPNKKEKLNYYVSQELWECKVHCGKHNSKSNKAKKSNKKRANKAKKSNKSNKNIANKAKKSNKKSKEIKKKSKVLNWFSNKYLY